VTSVPEPKHGRKLAISLIGLTNAKIGIAKGRIRREIFPAANDARDRMERLVIEDDFCNLAPFSWVGLSIREGLKNDLEPQFQGIDDEDGELALTIEIDVHDLLDATKEEMQLVIERAILRALLSIGERFDRPMASLRSEFAALEA
jgi:hypothetical protein